MADLGLIPIEDKMAKIKPSAYNVLVDGKVLGFVTRSDAPRIVDKLRILKIKKDDQRLILLRKIVASEIIWPQG